MNDVETVWSRLNRLLCLLLLASAILLVGAWYRPLIRENTEKRKVLLRLENDIKREEALLPDKKAAVDALRNDPKTVERLAREKLGLARPGETVVHFDEPSSNPSPVAR